MILASQITLTLNRKKNKMYGNPVVNTNIDPNTRFVFRETTDAQFERDVLKHSGPVFVMFYSPTCDACRTMEESINQIGVAFNGRLAFFKINVQNNPAYSSKYAGTGMPCSVIFSKGEIIRDTRIMDGQSVWTGNAANLQYFLTWLNNVLNIANENW